MRAAILVVLALAALSAVVAQQPSICASPPAWDARAHQIDPAGTSGFFVRGHYYYDALNRRDAFVEEIDSSQPRAFYWSIFLHKIAKAYRINLITGQCQSEKITWPWHPVGVQPVVCRGNVEVNAWGYLQPDGFTETVVTSVGCLPVSFSFISNGTDPKAPNYVHTSWYDIAPGINDPTKFVPPTNCS